MIDNTLKKVYILLRNLYKDYIEKVKRLPVELTLGLLSVNQLSYIRIDTGRNLWSLML